MIEASLNQYRIIGSLGAGGMGGVFRARATRLNREAAIKPHCNFELSQRQIQHAPFEFVRPPAAGNQEQIIDSGCNGYRRADFDQPRHGLACIDAVVAIQIGRAFFPPFAAAAWP
jgi:hypothetical protein